MLYRLLRPGELIENGLSAKNPFSDTTVLQHVTNRSDATLKSKFISTCGSLQAVLAFNGTTPNPIIVKIWEKNLPVVKIDLRTPCTRYIYSTDQDILFHQHTNMYQEVLFVGYIPETHVELCTPSDIP